MPAKLPSHPMQPIVVTRDGRAYFRANKIVRFLLDSGEYDLNKLQDMPFSRDDWNQFVQLIGYSVSGFGELSFARPNLVRKADARAAEIKAKKSGNTPTGGALC